MQLDHTLEANQRFRPIQCPNKELDESRPSKKIERKTREERTKHKAQSTNTQRKKNKEILEDCEIPNQHYSMSKYQTTKGKK